MKFLDVITDPVKIQYLHTNAFPFSRGKCHTGNISLLSCEQTVGWEVVEDTTFAQEHGTDGTALTFQH